MADKRIGDLPQSPSVSRLTKIPVEYDGSAQHVTGEQIAAFAKESVKEDTAEVIAEAEASAQAAEASAQVAYAHAQSVNPDEINSRIAMKGDNLFYDESTHMLYITSGGEIIGDGVQVATGTGGGGGGESNNAVLTLKNTSGWIYKSISSGGACPISFEWSSLEDDMPTGNGVLRITVNGTLKHTVQIEQGEKTLDIGEYLGTGSNAVKVNVTDVYGNSRSVNFNITTVSLLLESSFDASVAYTGAIAFPYTPTAAVEKTMHFKVDGNELPTVTVTTSGRQQTFTIPAQSHGSHKFEAYFTAVVDGEPVESNRLYYELICTEEGNTAPVITTSFRQTTAEQFESLVIRYFVYDPVNLTANVVLSAEGTDTPLTVDRTEQTWTYRPESIGDMTLSISCGKTVKRIPLTVTETTMDVDAETNDLSLYLTSYGRSNNEGNPSEWKYGNVAASLTGFNFTSDGWMEDEDGITVLRVGGDARVEIPLQMFAQDFRTTGKTIEFEFASRSVLDYDAVLATCWAGERGFEITAQQATLKSEQSEVTTRYKEDDHLRLSFVIEKRSKNRLILAYVNGIISGMLQYPDDDDFSQSEPVSISLGSNDCTLDVYNIRVYDNDLTRFQMLDNWIADTQNLGEKKDRYDRNDIFDDYGQILPDTLRPHQCYMILKCPVLPTYKGDKKTCSGEYIDPVHSDRSFTFEGAEIDVQGTSSQYYYVKNFKIKFKGGFKQNGKTNATYAMNANAVPTAEFTFKADVASSEGANNVVLAEMYNDLCPVKTPAQEANPKVRQTIEGHPIVMFHDDGNGAKFIGKYNFNNDKGTSEVFGFAPGDESWEILENGNALVSFKTDNFTGWETSFEARYPDKNKDITRLQQFVAWVSSTNTEGQSETEKAARLAKFKNELANWANVEDAIFYYLFTLIFLCIDQREKNAFPTYNAEMAKWLWLFYDADSSIGTDNKGNLTFEYWMEDIDFTEAGDPVFNGQNNVFWSNLRECFPDEIRDEYRRLRTEVGEDGKVLLSYDKVDELFEAHQSQWSEAIFNEDAWRKAVEPLEKSGDTQYLAMQQGKKEQHFKHWMYNRFRYLDSKFETGAALDEQNRIMMRAHAQGNIFLTSYINMYGQVYFNAERAEHRMIRDNEYEFEWNAQGAEDAVIGVNSAPMITSLGDLSPLKLEYAHIQYATHLTELKVGDASADYVNDNFVELTLGNNTLLRKLDVRNCSNLAQSVDASGCTNIEEVYFDGTAITGLSLPNGGILKKLHLPATVTNLTLRNQTKLTEFVMPNFANVTTLRLENVSGAVDGWTILHQIPANSRVRMIGFDWTQGSPEAVLSLYDYLDTMRGLDENGNNVDKAQMSGTIRIDSITGAQLAEMQRRYPSITVMYNHIASNLYFYNDTGSTLLYTASCTDGADGVYVGDTPTKEDTNEAAYTFAGWSMTPGGEADEDALKNVKADRNVYAAFSATPKYAVEFRSDGNLLTTQYIIEGGNAHDPVAAGDIDAPTKTGDDNTVYAYSGWDGELTNITSARVVNATYTPSYAVRFCVDTTVLNTQWVEHGANAIDPISAGYIGTPTKATTAQYTYTYKSWDGNYTNVTAPMTIQAVFTATVRTYTVTWKNGSTTLETDTNVPYGTTPTYNGSTPAYTGSGDAADYTFNGWTPAVGAITGDTTYTAAFKYTGYVYSTLIDGSISGNYANDTVTSVGDYAFTGCTDLTGVSMAMAASIGVGAFSGCSGLVSADFPEATSMGADAFRNCRNLEVVNVSKVTAIQTGAFYGCAKLTTVRLNATEIGSTAFQMCEALTALVLYSETMVTLGAANALTGTPIANGTGYIYVPAALIATYQADSKWSSRAAQFRALEDYPEYWDQYSWMSVNYHIEQGDYATFYKIGDEIPLNLGSEGLLTMQVAAFDTDDLADGSGKAPITFVAKDVFGSAVPWAPMGTQTGSDGKYVEGTGTIGGWEKCSLRAYLLETIEPLIPEAVRSRIVAVTKKQQAVDTTGATFSQTTTDRVWIPAETEVDGSSCLYAPLYDSTNASRVKSERWWLRNVTDKDNVRSVPTTGKVGYSPPKSSYYICLGFCIGRTPT